MSTREEVEEALDHACKKLDALEAKKAHNFVDMDEPASWNLVDARLDPTSAREGTEEQTSKGKGKKPKKKKASKKRQMIKKQQAAAAGARKQRARKRACAEPPDEVEADATRPAAEAGKQEPSGPSFQGQEQSQGLSEKKGHSKGRSKGQSEGQTKGQSRQQGEGDTQGKANRA